MAQDRVLSIECVVLRTFDPNQINGADAMERLPESPEAIAWMLFVLLFERDKPERNEPLETRALDLYAECLRTVRGSRAIEDLRRH